MNLHRTRGMASTADFKRIMSALLGQDEDSSVAKAFENANIDSVADIVGLSFEDVDNLRHRDPAALPPINEELSIGHKALIRVFNACVETRNDEGDPVHNDFQNKATKADFGEFRMIGFAKCFGKHRSPASTKVTPAALTGTNSLTVSKVRQPFLEFKKGSRRDPVVFTVMKDNKQWDSFHRTL